MIVLMLGSGPSAKRCRAWPKAPFDAIVAINNAWQLRHDWDHLIYPHDFPAERMPPCTTGKSLIDETDFVPANNAFGGFLYAGATMAFTATYWALHTLKPTLIAYLGCDMVYPKTGETHFYGQGTADPLRADASLRSLEAKSARARCHAAKQGCALVNLSVEESRLLLPRAQKEELSDLTPLPVNKRAMAMAEAAEARLDYRTPTGFHDHLEPDLAALDAIDRLWIRAGGSNFEQSEERGPSRPAA